MNKPFWKTGIFWIHIVGLAFTVMAIICAAITKEWNAFIGDLAAAVWCLSSLAWCKSAIEKK